MHTGLNTRRFVLAMAVMATLVVGIATVSPGRGFAYQTRKPVGAPFGAFSIAQNLAVDQVTGNVFATDGGSDETVNVYGPEGGPPVGGIPTRLTGALTPSGSFNFSIYPAGVAVDNTCYLRGLQGGECASTDPSNGDIYVSDGLDEVVDKFRVNGKSEFEFICEFGGHGGIVGTSCLPEGGEPTNRFIEPWGLAIDGDGDIYVTDWGSSAIYEYNDQGEELGSFSSPLLGAPEYVTVDPDGTVYGQSYSFNNIVEFKRSSPTGPVEGEPFVVAHGKSGIAYDPIAHHVIYETGSGIQEVNSNGEITGGFPQGPFENGVGLAYAQTSGQVYAVEGFESFSKSGIQAFGPKLIVPDATTGEAFQVQPNNATLHGVLNPLGIASKYYFQYGETEAYGSATLAVPAGEANAQAPVQMEVDDLAPNTTYHFRLVGEDENGIDTGADQTFTTVAIRPTAGQISVSDVTRDGMLLHAAVNPEAAMTSYHFACVDQADYQPAADNPYAHGLTTESASVGSKYENAEVEQLLAGLEPATTYHCAVVASNKVGVVIGSDETVASGNVTPPVGTTDGSTDVGQNTATVSGVVDSNGLATTYGFEIGTGAGYGPPTGLGGIGAGESHANVSLGLTGLVPGTTYHYRLVATSIDGTSYGADQTFTTSLFSSVFAIPPASLPFLSTPQIAFPKPPSSHAIKRHKKKPVHKRLHRKPKRKKKK